MEKMKSIMGEFHKGLEEIAGNKIIKMVDYSQGVDGLPKSDVLKFYMESGAVVIRPSGTEPKLKAYTSITAKTGEEAWKLEKAIKGYLEKELILLETEENKK